MAKKRANKNRSARKRAQLEQAHLAMMEKARREELDRIIGFLMMVYSVITLILVALSVFQITGNDLLFVWSIVEIAFGFTGFIGCCMTASDKVLKRMVIVVLACAATSIITALICG